MTTVWRPGKRPVFIGAGHTMLRRAMPGSKASRTREAALMAIADAGLQVKDIDGVFVWAETNWEGPGGGIGVGDVGSVLPWENIKFWLQPEGVYDGSLTGIQCAALSLSSGAVNYALILRSGHHPQRVRYRQISNNRAPGANGFSLTYGHGVGGANQAMTYQRYLSKYGAKPEEMAGYVLTAHENGQDSPFSYWAGKPITREDYMNARMIAHPMNIYDNDMPVEGVLAVVMTTEDRAKDTPHPGGYISGMSAVPFHERRTGIVDSLEVQEAMGARMARNLYESAGVGPDDIDLKQIYDGFSPMVWMWSEAFGFAPKGEGHNWAQPQTIGRTGPHPVNTSGGSLGNGRLQGFVQIHETAVQMMGTAGPRQIANADVALCQTGPFGNGTSVIVTKS